jgi:hypothetical protein
MKMWTMKTEREVCRQIECPKCGAKIGQPCKNKHGEDSPKSHGQRAQFAMGMHAAKTGEMQLGGLTEKGKEEVWAIRRRLILVHDELSALCELVSEQITAIDALKRHAEGGGAVNNNPKGAAK